MKHDLSLALALCVTTSVASAGPRPAFADLPLAPTIAVTPPAPEAIADTERVAGVVLRSGRHFDADLDALVDSAVPAVAEDDDEAAEGTGARWLTTVVERGCLSPLGGSEATRRQILAADVGVYGFTRARLHGAALEFDTIWVDSRSRGVRAAPGTRIPLRLVAGAENALRLYAYRTAKTLELLVAAPRGAHLSAFGKGQNHFSQCGLLQLSMSAAQGAAAMDVGAELHLPLTADERKHAERGLPMSPRTKLWSAHASISRTRSDRAPILSFVVREEISSGMVAPAHRLR